MGEDYEKTINQIKFEELKGNLKVVALVATGAAAADETGGGF